MVMTIAHRVADNPRLKQLIHYLLIPKGQARPRWWVSWFVNPFIHKKGKGARICRSARLDVLPFRKFELADQATIEDFCVINNGVGDVTIGPSSRVGISSVVIGPVRIGTQVIIAQHVVISGLNHSYESLDKPIRLQPPTSRCVVIEDECWIGANAVITAGVRIGKHSVVAAGSIVTKDVPPYSVVGGNPARLLKAYNPESQSWEKVRPQPVS
jgi:acetyltransferase-like isoleucine patch superfamily enzyme